MLSGGLEVLAQKTEVSGGLDRLAQRTEVNGGGLERLVQRTEDSGEQEGLGESMSINTELRILAGQRM